MLGINTVFLCLAVFKELLGYLREQCVGENVLILLEILCNFATELVKLRHLNYRVGQKVSLGFPLSCYIYRQTEMNFLANQILCILVPWPCVLGLALALARFPSHMPHHSIHSVLLPD